MTAAHIDLGEPGAIKHQERHAHQTPVDSLPASNEDGFVMGRRHLVLAVASSAVIAGCSGGGVPSADPPGSFAGYSKGEAASSATYVLRSQLAEPTSPLYQQELEVGNLETGKMDDGTRAWVAHLEDFDRRPSSWCLLVRAGQTSSPNKPVVYDVQRCDAITT